MIDTHEGKPQTKALAPIEDLRQKMGGQYMKQITNFYMGDEEKAKRFMTSAIEYVRRVPKLLECDRTSLMMSLVQLAQFNFLPSNVAGEAYIIPYGPEAKFQLGYQGLVSLFYRAGIKKITGEIIRENDTYSYKNGVLEHDIDMTKTHSQRGKPIGAYVAIVLPSGETAYKYMNADDILAHGKKFSKAFNKADSPWKPENDPELWMWKKTVLVQAGKLVPKNAEIQQAIAKDYEASTLHKAPALDAAGPGAGAALHTLADETPQSEDDTNTVANGEQKNDE